MNEIMECYVSAFKNYTNFEGKTSKKTYWSFVLVNFMIAFVLGAILGRNGFVLDVYNLVALLPGIAIATRRLHDINKSGWYQALVLIPVIGWIILIVLLTKDSVTTGNKY